MPTPRILYTFITVIAGLAVAPVLPKNVELRPTAVAAELPTFVGDWFGESISVSQKELDTLAPDTRFDRRVYTNLEGRTVTASIVVSGHDLNSSIHRPERCLPAQGWTVNKSEKQSLPVAGLSASPVPLTRLTNYSFKELQPGTQGLPQGGTERIFNLNTYVFVGADILTRSHYERTFRDMGDRVFLGQNQQWAYVTFSANYGHHVVPNSGDSPEKRAEMEKLIEEDRIAADKALQEFMVEVLPEILPKWRQSI